MKTRFTILLSIIIVIAGCTTAPRETIELAEIVDYQIAEMQVSHEKFVHLYYDKLRDEVDYFLENRTSSIGVYFPSELGSSIFNSIV